MRRLVAFALVVVAAALGPAPLAGRASAQEPEGSPPPFGQGAGEGSESTIDALRTPVSTPASYVFEAAGRSGYATAPIRGGVNPFGAGFGARAGLTLGPLYVGGTVMDFLGGSDGSATDTALLFGLEAGYTLQLGEYLALRPRFGFGDTILSHSEPRAGGVDVVTSASGSSSFGGSTVTTQVKNVYVEPGLALFVGYGRFFVGADLGVLVLPGILYGPAPAQQTTWISYNVTGQLGFRL